MTASLLETSISPRRRLTNVAATFGMIAALALTLAPLAWVLFYVASKGLRYLGPQFITQTPPGNVSSGGGGFYNGIMGTIEIVGMAFLIAAPVGIMTAVYIVEYGRGRFVTIVRFFTDVLVGIPTIVIGAFVYSFYVLRFGFSGFAGSIALAIVMVPIIARSTEEVLRLVPNSMREASLALGVPEWRTIVSVTLPAAASGITTALLLATARAAGETAPLLLTALGNDLFVEYNPTKRMTTLSLQIFGNAISGFKAGQARAWAGALTLIGMVLLLTLAGRLLATRTTRHLGRAKR